MRRLVLAVLAATLVLVGCGGGDDGEDPALSEAFCRDLDSGLSVAQTFSGQNLYEPEELPDRAWGMALASCPEQLHTNEGLRGFLEANGIDPDTELD